MTSITAIGDHIAASGINAPWATPDRSLIAAALPAAPRLPVECFGAAADYLRRAANGANVRPDYVAAMLLAAVGALKGKSYIVRLSGDWFEVLTIWLAIIGPPSSGKTPACKPIRRKLKSLELKLAEQHRQDVERDLIHAEADGAKPAELDWLRELIDKPPRFVVNDSTSEALARIEARSPHGLLVERDELAGLVEALERYSAGVDRAYYLEAFNGGPFTLDRVKAGTIAIPDHCFAICGGMQPDRLRALLTHSSDDDGFAARLLFFWPEMLPAGSIPKGADHSQMEAALDAIASLSPPDGRAVLRLTHEAYQVLDSWYINDRAKRLGVTGKAGSAFGKLPGLAGRLAGLLHMIDWAFKNDGSELELTITKQYVAAALTLIECYFVPQIERAYHGSSEAPADALAGAILRAAKKRGTLEINLRTVRRGWSLPGSRAKGSTKLFSDAAAVLLDTGWAKANRQNGGSSDLILNPALIGD